MSDTSYKLWCLVEGEESPFSVTAHSNISISELKEVIKAKKENALQRVDASSLKLWKVNVDLNGIIDDIENAKYQFNPGDQRPLRVTNKVSEFWLQPPLQTQLHIYISKSSDLISPSTSQYGSPLSVADSPDYPWLAEVHSKIWNKKKELQQVLFREVQVTRAHFTKLQERLVDRHLDRDSPGYNGKVHDVRSVKLGVLIPPRYPGIIDPEASDAEMDVDSPEASDKDRYGIESPFPSTLKFLDLTPLGLKNVSSRMPSPLFVRQEYDDITALIEYGSENDPVVVSGQPGTGKTAYLHLRVIQSMIEGRPFLYQGREGTVYYINEEGVQTNSTWPSSINIMAFVDADKSGAEPRSILWQNNVRVILASSPKGTQTSWVKQKRPDIKIIATELWSEIELFMAGVFLYPFDISLKLLWESTSYFGYNPRLCFSSACSVAKLKMTKADVESRITRADFKKSNMVQMLNASQTGDLTVSHSIFQISPKDKSRNLAECKFNTVSQWAFKHFAEVYECHDAHEAISFYRQISTSPRAASLWGHVFEAKVLNHIDVCGCNFGIRRLSPQGPGTVPWTCGGPIPRFTFLQGEDFVHGLTKAIEDGKDSLHLVPSVPNFKAVDSILYTRGDVLTLIQCTISEEHPIRVAGLTTLRNWLKTDILKSLRPSKVMPWRFIFVVPPSQASNFKKQTLVGKEEGHWASWVQQHVLGLNIFKE